jgi:zinc carboxypeptidase
MFISPQRRSAPAVVLGSPRITAAPQARDSGKPVIFLFGNIHPPEPEATEALLMLARDLAIGKRKELLANQIVMIAPIFNVDGTDTFVTQDGSLGSEPPYILGVRENSQGLDLNRDAVKLRTVEARGLYRVLNEWNPVLLLDGHLMSRVSHGYANTYGTTTVPAAAPAPRDYTHDTLFPAVREMVRRDFGLEAVGGHCRSDSPARTTSTWRRRWPTPRSTTSNRRREMDSSVGDCSMTRSVSLAPPTARSSPRSSRLAAN